LNHALDMGLEWRVVDEAGDTVVPARDLDPIRGPILLGDFYVESPDDVMRCALEASDEPGFLFGTHEGQDLESGSAFPGPYNFPGLYNKARAWPDNDAQEESSGQEEWGTTHPSVGRFTETDLPLMALTSPCWGLAACTFSVLGCSPAILGNHLLDFLGTQVTSSFTKLNPAKFTIKADVFIDGAMCTIKIRFYSEKRGALRVEFSRRGGSCLCFGSVYRQAGEYLRQRLVVIGAPEAEGACVPPSRSGEFDAAAISPLIDMAGLADLPALQAESAAALVEQVRDNEVAASLCTAHAFKYFKTLLKADETAVAHPTAQMLSHLSLRPEATPCFADEELLSLITTKVQSEVTSSLVQQELAQVVSNAVSRGAVARVTEDVKRTLALARRNASTWNTPSRMNSGEGRRACKRIRTPVPGSLDPSASVQRGGTGLPGAGSPSASGPVSPGHWLLA